MEFKMKVWFDITKVKVVSDRPFIDSTRGFSARFVIRTLLLLEFPLWAPTMRRGVLCLEPH